MAARRKPRYTAFSVSDFDEDDEDEARESSSATVVLASRDCCVKPSQCLTVLVSIAIVTSILAIALTFSSRNMNHHQVRSLPPLLSFNFITNTSGISEKLYKFSILQIADIHLGEAPDTDWGPQQDNETWHALRSILSHNRPDLIIFSGDQITASNNIKYNATTYYKILGDFIEVYHIPWGIIFGNHDDENYAATFRSDLIQFIQQQNYGYSVTRQDSSPNGVFGVSNYVLNVTLLMNDTAAQIFLLDSGGGTLPNKLLQSQLDWIAAERVKDVPAVVFQHMPTAQHVFHDGKQQQQQLTCVGSNGDGGISPLDYDPGIVDFLSKDGNVHFLAVGHMHGNSYCCPTSISNNKTLSDGTAGVLSLCFGRHSGYGGFKTAATAPGNFSRGSRIYQLMINMTEHEADERGEFSYRSWIQMEEGNTAEAYIPPLSLGAL